MTESREKLSAEHPPEIAVLISCMRQRIAGKTGAVIKTPLNWRELFRYASIHRLLPLLHDALSADRSAIPGTEWSRLHDEYLRIAVVNHAWADELVRLYGALAGAGIEAMTFRGPTMAQRLYGDLSMRQFSDLDLLVKRSAAIRAGAVLAASGTPPQMPLSGWRERAYVHFQTERVFLREAERLCVDLHWSLLPPSLSFATEEELWSRRLGFEFNGAPFHTLGEEDAVLHLCAHGAKHGWDRLALVMDLAMMIRGCSEVRLAAAFEQARRAGRENMVRLGLLLACDIAGLELPGRMGELVLGPHEMEPIAARIKERLLSVPVMDRHAERARPVVAAVMERPIDRFRHAAELVVVPTGIEIGMVSLPRPLWGLYRALRVGRLMLKHSIGRLAGGAVR